MARSRLLMLVTLIFATFGVAHAAAQSAAEADLRRIVQEMLDAVAPGNGEVWQRYLHERVIHVDETGTVRTKKELLAEFTPLPPGLVGRIAIDRFKIETHGDIAVVAYEIQEHLDYHGQILRSRFRMNDTWLKTEQGWRLLAEQVAAVLKDPPSVKLKQRAAVRIQRLILVDRGNQHYDSLHAGRVDCGAQRSPAGAVSRRGRGCILRRRPAAHATHLRARCGRQSRRLRRSSRR